MRADDDDDGDDDEGFGLLSPFVFLFHLTQMFCWKEKIKVKKSDFFFFFLVLLLFSGFRNKFLVPIFFFAPWSIFWFQEFLQAGGEKKTWQTAKCTPLLMNFFFSFGICISKIIFKEETEIFKYFFSNNRVDGLTDFMYWKSEDWFWIYIVFFWINSPENLGSLLLVAIHK